MKDYHYLVPEQTIGELKDIEHAAEGRSVEDAEDWFVDAKERLLDVNNWKKYGSFAVVNFRLTDSHGKPVKRNVHPHDHICIENAGQPNAAFDWVTVEALEYDDYPDIDMESFAMRIRPSSHPVGRNGIADEDRHEATSTFVIERRGKNLHATYHGRNKLAIELETEYASDDDSADRNAWLGLTDELIKGMIKGFLD